MFYHDAEYRYGVDLFNQGRFWECHEALEHIWQQDPRPARVFYQGLIQIAAAFYHFGRQNMRGMRTLLHEGSEKLERFRPFHEGIDLDRLLEDVGAWRQALDEVSELPSEGLDVPTIVLQERQSRS